MENHGEDGVCHQANSFRNFGVFANHNWLCFKSVNNDSIAIFTAKRYAFCIVSLLVLGRRKICRAD